MLTLKPTDLGASKLKDDYEVLDEGRRSIGRIILNPHARQERPWLWTISAGFKQTPLTAASYKLR